MENSSASTTLQDSPIVFPPNAFRWYVTIPFVVGAFLIFLILTTVGIIAYGVANHLSFTETLHQATSIPGVVIQGIAEVLIIVFIVSLLPVVAQTSLAGIGFRKISAANVWVIVGGAVLMFVIVTPLASIFESLLHFKQPESAIAVFTQTSGWRRAVFALFGVVLAPAFEETFFRLLLFNALRKWWGFWPGAIVSSIFFGIAHAQPDPHGHFTAAMFASITLPLAVGGVVLCGVYAKTNNAWSSFLTHGGFNAFTLILLALFPSLAK